MLDPIITRLVTFHPDVIAVENVAGLTCDDMARSPSKYDPAALRPYCFDISQAAAATGLDVPTAAMQLAATLKSWPANPTAAQRRNLALLALAAGEPATARLQWRELAPTERLPEDGLTAGLIAQLTPRRDGEVELLAIPVAAKLGLARLLPMDDHTGDYLDVADPAAFGQALKHAWHDSEGFVKAARAREEALEDHHDALGLYRLLNDPATRRLFADADFGAAGRDTSVPRYGQRYVAGWDTRNLRMAANVAEAIRDNPDAKILVIVGAQHKLWLDRILGQMSSVEIVDAESVLQ